jgi:hypothetical protein
MKINILGCFLKLAMMNNEITDNSKTYTYASFNFEK